MGKSSCPCIRQWFLRNDTEAQATKEKVDKLDLIKIKTRASKDSVKKVKR